QAAKGEQIALACDAGGINLTAYATREPSGAVTLAVINKDSGRAAAVEVSGILAGKAQVMRLTAPSLTSMNGVTLGGAAVSGDGSWSGKSDPVKIIGGKALVDVPAGSAALIAFT